MGKFIPLSGGFFMGKDKRGRRLLLGLMGEEVPR